MASRAILFRAPHGKKLLVLPWLLARDHRRHILFDVVPRDDETQEVALLDGGRRKPGTLQAVDQVLAQLSAQGYRFVTVSELLALAKPRPPSTDLRHVQ